MTYIIHDGKIVAINEETLTLLYKSMLRAYYKTKNGHYLALEPGKEWRVAFMTEIAHAILNNPLYATKEGKEEVSTDIEEF